MHYHSNAMLRFTVFFFFLLLPQSNFIKKYLLCDYFQNYYNPPLKMMKGC